MGRKNYAQLEVQCFSSLQNFLMAGGAEQDREWERGRLLQRVESTKKTHIKVETALQ